MLLFTSYDIILNGNWALMVKTIGSPDYTGLRMNDFKQKLIIKDVQILL